ncbi:hypothetical protein TIFTF001_034229 [Ficus carica]|uniref:Uncharacterized protein n=1 Tax=Ficus carica TaxID=3494 RepID=A0AA88E3D4_FICCA|nr:hypothetical protein TIFTF001_034229 [Ficus carica]
MLVYNVKEYDMLSCFDGTIDQERRTICKYNSAYSMDKTSKFSYVVPTCHGGGFKRFSPWFELDWISYPNHSMLNYLVDGLSWIGLAATTTPWLCATVRAHMICKQPTAMLDARLWRDGTADCEIWVRHRHGF